MANLNFIDDETFHQRVKETEALAPHYMQWGELPENTTFKIETVERVMFHWGASWLVTATDIFKVQVKVWAPRGLIVYLRDNMAVARAFYFQSGGNFFSFFFFFPLSSFLFFGSRLLPVKRKGKKRKKRGRGEGKKRGEKKQKVSPRELDLFSF